MHRCLGPFPWKPRHPPERWWPEAAMCCRSSQLKLPSTSAPGFDSAGHGGDIVPGGLGGVIVRASRPAVRRGRLYSPDTTFWRVVCVCCWSSTDSVRFVRSGCGLRWRCPIIVSTVRVLVATPESTVSLQLIEFTAVCTIERFYQLFILVRGHNRYVRDGRQYWMRRGTGGAPVEAGW